MLFIKDQRKGKSIMPESIKRPLKYTTAFIKHNAVLCISAVLSIITCLVIPPDAKYIEYFDFKTLTCLFCTLAVVCALKNIRFFTIIAKTIVKKSGTLAVPFQTARTTMTRCFRLLNASKVCFLHSDKIISDIFAK